MSTDTEIPTHLNMRINPKLRYITELAARVRRMSITDYIEAVLQESFKKVSVDPIPGFDEEASSHELTLAERLEILRDRERRVSNPLSDIADNLWSEYPLVRIQLLAGPLDHLMSEDQKALWEYIHSRDDFKIKQGKGYKLNRKLIVDNWKTIKADFEKSKKGGKK